jgi:hypothetical protein
MLKRLSVTMNVRLRARTPEDALDGGQVLVRVDDLARPREPQAVDEAGVVALVGEHEVVARDEGLQRPHVGGVAGGEEKRGLRAAERPPAAPRWW